jgi:hypothetical protein
MSCHLQALREAHLSVSGAHTLQSSILTRPFFNTEVEPEAMETGDDYVALSEAPPRKGAGKKVKLAPRLPDMGLKPSLLKRGQRSTNQRRRKAGKLAKVGTRGVLPTSTQNIPTTSRALPRATINC